MKNIFTIIFVTFVLGGCVSSQVKDYSAVSTNDGKQTAINIQRLAIRVDSPSDVGVATEAEKILIDKLKDFGLEVMLWNDFLPPTRTYSLNEMLSAMKANKVDAFLKIAVGASVKEDRIMGYTSHSWDSGSGSINGNNISYSGSSSGFVAPIRKVKRDTNSAATLFNSKDASIVWKADNETNAGGLLFMGDNATASSMVSEYLKALEDRGFINKSEKPDARKTALVTPIKVASVISEKKTLTSDLLSSYDKCARENDIYEYSLICAKSGLAIYGKELPSLRDKLNSNYLDEKYIEPCLKSYEHQVQNCSTPFIKKLKDIDPETAKKATAIQENVEILFEKLFAKKITIGDFLKGYSEAVTNY